jgi:uncharacterized protein YegP (UPF0339 family)
VWKFEVYKDQDAGWRWRLVLRNAVIVESSELFARRVDAKRAVEGARAKIDKTVIDVARRAAGMPEQAVAVHEDAVHANAVHAELRTDVARWNSLPLVGFQLYGEAHEMDAVVIELRHCMCGSTLGRRVSSRADLVDRLRTLTEALAHMPFEA